MKAVKDKGDMGMDTILDVNMVVDAVVDVVVGAQKEDVDADVASNA